MNRSKYGIIFAGLCAGAINGLFGAGGGMVLVPLLIAYAGLKEESIFPCSIAIILPISIVSLLCSLAHAPFDWTKALPYVLGSATGGLLACIIGKRIPTIWLHKILGILILWGGFRYLC